MLSVASHHHSIDGYGKVVLCFSSNRQLCLVLVPSVRFREVFQVPCTRVALLTKFCRYDRSLVLETYLEIGHVRMCSKRLFGVLSWG
jgi:hypothetical protein